MNSSPNVIIRNGIPQDHEKILSVMPEWWEGRDLSSSLLKIFFIHFKDTLYIAENGRELVGFLVGFLSQSEKDVGYIHFAGVRPQYRKAGMGRRLYETFFAACEAKGRTIVKSCTSPVNKLSIAFHQKIGFEIEPGDGMIEGIPVSPHYLGKNIPKVLFKKYLPHPPKKQPSY